MLNRGGVVFTNKNKQRTTDHKMKYLSWINLLLLIISFIISLLYTPVTGYCLLTNIKPTIIAIGRLAHGRPGSIKVRWNSVNSLGSPVLYQVLYNKTSVTNHCVDATTDPLQVAKDCNQNSTGEGVIHECDLTEEYNMLKIENLKDSLCVVISMRSTSSNKTCYSLSWEFISYGNEDEVHCPVPDDVKVYSFEAGKLEVHWNISPKFVGDTALSEMSFNITYKAVGKSSRCILEETKTLSGKFLRQNNSYIIQGLGPCCPFIVTICCIFPDARKCHPDYVSRPYYVTVAEQVPRSAPQVVMYHIQYTNLLIKWKISSDSLCINKITAYEIQYWDKQGENCATISNGSAIKKYVTNSKSDRAANITGVRPTVAQCFRIRMCNHRGCSTWGMVRSVESYPRISAKRIAPSTSGLTKSTELVVVIGLSVLVLMVLVVVCVIIKTRDRPGRPRRLEDTVPNLEPATDLLDSSLSTVEMELDDDYSTAYVTTTDSRVCNNNSDVILPQPGLELEPQR